MRQALNILALWFFMQSVPTLQAQDHVLGIGLGLSLGTISADIGNKSEKRESANYIASVNNLFTNFDLDAKSSLEVGGSLLINMDSLQSSQLIGSGVFAAYKHHIVGGSHKIREGSKTLSVVSSSPIRVSIPAYLKYDTIDFNVKNPESGAKVKMSGSLLEFSSGAQAEYDVGTKSYGISLLKSLVVIPASAKSLMNDSITLMGSIKFYF